MFQDTGPRGVTDDLLDFFDRSHVLGKERNASAELSKRAKNRLLPKCTRIDYDRPAANAKPDLLGDAVYALFHGAAGSSCAYTGTTGVRGWISSELSHFE
jgi:hypothetical protein